MNHLQSKSRSLTRPPHRTIAKAFKTDEQSVKPAIKHLLLLGALLCVCLSTSNAKARSRYYAPPPTLQAGCSDPVLHPCVGMDLLATQKNIVEAGRMPSQSIAMRPSIEVDDRSPQRATSQAYGANEWRQVVETPIVPNRARSLFRTRSQQPKATRIGAIVSPLAAKVREISSSCGSSIVSSVRHTHIA